MSRLNRRGFVKMGIGGMAAAGIAGVSRTSAKISSASAEEPNLSAEEIGKLGKTPHTKFAVNVEMWWRKLPFLDRLKKAVEFGFPAVEFWPWQGKDLKEVERYTKDHNLEIAQFTAWGFKPGMNDPANHEAFLKAVEEGCKVAKQLNVKKMTVVGGDDIPGKTQAEMHKEITKALKRAAPIAEKFDVMLILEPMNIRVDHKGHCLYGSPAPVKICRDVNSTHVKLNWDLYHMHISEGDLCGHMKEGFDQIGYLQLADHPGRNEPGTGEIHYNRVLKEAYALGYRGYVGLECNPKTTELAAAIGVAKADIW